MTYVYRWTNPEQTMLSRVDQHGNVTFVPTDPANRDYSAFLASGQQAIEFSGLELSDEGGAA